MRKLVAYLATVADAWTDRGERVWMDSIPSAEPLDATNYELRLFARAVDDADADTEIVVVLTDEAETLEGPPGTQRMQQFFSAWQQQTGRQVHYQLLPNTVDPSRFYACLSDVVDVWLDAYDHIDVYLGGDDSTADALAWVSCLHGHRFPDYVRVHTFQHTVLDHPRLLELPLNGVISTELTREHALERVMKWEFIEVRALATMHHELADVRPLLEATARFLQRKDAPLRDLGMLETPEIPGQWHYTHRLCHAVEVAEYLMTVGRHEEEVAWCVSLALGELAPAAWAEHYLSQVLGEHVPLDEGLDVLARRDLPDLRDAGERYLKDLGEPVYDGAPADALRLLARVGAPALQLGDELVRRRALPQDCTLPTAPLPHVAWLAARWALRDTRNRLAHHYADLDEHTLADDVLRPAARRARELATSVVELRQDPDDDVGVVHQRRILAIVEDAERSLPPLAEDQRPGGRRARRVWRRLQDARPLELEEVAAWTELLGTWCVHAPQQQVHVGLLAAALDRLRREGHHAAFDQLVTAIRARLPVASAPLDDRDRRRLTDLFPDDAFLPEPLDAGTPMGPLRELLGVFTPAVRQRANPMVAVRDWLRQALTASR